jgi:hypothetical protein
VDLDFFSKAYKKKPSTITIHMDVIGFTRPVCHKLIVLVKNINTAMTNIQARLRCKHASKPPSPLNGDPVVDANLALKPSQHLAEFFNQPLTHAPICIYGWIHIQKIRRLAYTLTLSLACMLSRYP